MRSVIPSELRLHASPLFPTDSANGVVHGAVSLVDVDNCAIPHPSRLGNILGSCSIVMRLIQQFQGLAKAAVGTHPCINRRVIFEILAVID